VKQVLKRIYAWVRRPAVWVVSIAAVAVVWIAKVLLNRSSDSTTPPPASITPEQAEDRREEIKTEYDNRVDEIKSEADKLRDRIAAGRNQ